MRYASFSCGSWKKPGFLGRVFSAFFPQANPDFQFAYQHVKCWWLEIDEAGQVQREIALDASGQALALAPFGRNLGIFTDLDSAPSPLGAEVSVADFKDAWDAAYASFSAAPAWGWRERLRGTEGPLRPNSKSIPLVWRTGGGSRFVIGETDFGVDADESYVRVRREAGGNMLFSISVRGDKKLLDPLNTPEGSEWSWALYPPEFYLTVQVASRFVAEGGRLNFARRGIDQEIGLYMMEHCEVENLAVQAAPATLHMAGTVDMWGKSMLFEISCCRDPRAPGQWLAGVGVRQAAQASTA